MDSKAGQSVSLLWPVYLALSTPYHLLLCCIICSTTAQDGCGGDLFISFDTGPELSKDEKDWEREREGSMEQDSCKGWRNQAGKGMKRG